MNLSPLKNFGLKIQVILLIIITSGCAGTMPSGMGEFQLSLNDCPSTPNCVSSFKANGNGFLKPINTHLDQQASILKLQSIVAKNPNMSLIKQIDHYLYVQFSSSLWGFVDDMEFIVENQLIHFRSASRLGYSDFGANKKHIEIIRQSFQ